MVLIRALISAGALLAGGTPGTPAFNQYPAKVSRSGTAATPRMTDPRSRLFRTALREAATSLPDFAGHYVLAQIGCGAGCIRLAAIDRLSGRVVWFPSTVSNWPIEVTEPLSYRRDSRLLGIQGQLDEKGSGEPHFYVFDGMRFKPIS